MKKHAKKCFELKKLAFIGIDSMVCDDTGEVTPVGDQLGNKTAH